MSERELPQPVGSFSDTEALEMLRAYRRDPTNVPCPRCGPDLVEVLGFIRPDGVGEDGTAELVEPEGAYAAALFCHQCRHAIGIVP